MAKAKSAVAKKRGTTASKGRKAKPAGSKPKPRSQAETRSLGQRLAESARRTLGALRDAHPDEHFYFLALWTTEDGGYVAPTGNSEEALARSVQSHLVREAKKPVPRDAATLMQRLRFSAADSEYHGDEDIEGLPGGPALHEACFEALELLDAEGFFGKGSAREKVLVNVVYGDMSRERWLSHARRLNPRAVVDAIEEGLRS